MVVDVAMKLVPPGSTSVRVTAVADCGPVLRATIVNRTDLPFPVATPVLVTDTSADAGVDPLNVAVSVESDVPAVTTWVAAPPSDHDPNV
jgi:hypothetical protein